MTRLLALAVCALLAACSGGGHHPSPPPTPQPTLWTIGPIINGTNYSHGTPLHPPSCGAVLCFTVPTAPGSVHYVTRPTGPLASASHIFMRYRVDLDPGAKIVPYTGPEYPSLLTLYFQRDGDDWSANGKYETYRWYASFATVIPITEGEHTIDAPFSSRWTAVRTSDSVTAVAAFNEARLKADNVGFVLGGGDGLGHGVFATGPATITVLEFKVE